ncbi:MAG: Elongation factor Ts [Microgenomates group bacterium GW2011_GWA1_48_10]|uniref:Elongation factor Ts n=1 Tax=Candidatus Gottesmanbacteria bacterium RIFCSPHIGHO2_01_FULL_47_48 TaxID=1798381 RepID=A0A1F6A3Y3_9BACT|nr:MAG: Elongation factor Ts [Microgenomates group bacterium GW2011_GWA1_48_10]OGG18967.1 MAG: translation elongation factor Ts [Candidatus Gottesmanbacteria bacterium RIFCSPHIGHO2_01_FULL_47_48]
MVKVDDIKKLREMTGAGIADCREALAQANNNVDGAVELLKKRGIEKAEKKSERETHQGRVFSYVHGGKIGVLVALLCETDFVAKTDDFQNLGKEICLQVASMEPRNVAELLEQEYIRDPKLTISDMIKSVIGKLGENIRVGEFSRIEL